MNAPLRSTISIVALLLLEQLCHAQLGATRGELIKRYGSCEANPDRQTNVPNVYDRVIDVGEDCTFYDGRIRVMALFKSDRVVGFFFSKQLTFWEGILHPFRHQYLPFSDSEISTLLHTAAPKANWLAIDSEGVARRWRTSDGSAAAYYFAGGYREPYHLIVYTSAVDEVFRGVSNL